MSVSYKYPPEHNNPNAPSSSIVLVTPADTDLTWALREVRVAVAGNLAVMDAEGNIVVIPSAAILPGVPIPGWFTQIRFTGTTATGIVGWT